MGDKIINGLDIQDLNDQNPSQNRISFNITFPDRCLVCGTYSKDMVNKGWLSITLNFPGLVLVACTNCGAVFTNKEAVSNVMTMNEINEEVRKNLERSSNYD